MPTERELANAIRALAMDAVQKANSGHPGMPMGMADMATVLWREHLKHNPSNPSWSNRDRFVLSNGHGAMLQYALLHLTGYDVTLDDLRQFRQLHSKTPGHPEFGETPGVETTTGPLGQGLAAAVGMAVAERMLASQFNQPGFDLVDHFTYVFTGDGCLMEGISHEACSLAGTLALGKLIVFWDDNGISIDGDVSGWFTDDTPGRFEAYRWHVVRDVDGHDARAIREAIQSAQAVTDKPTLICCKTIIGYGSPNKAGTASSHGSPLGDDEVNLARKQLGWEHAPFEIPAAISDAWDAKSAGQVREDQWNQLFARYESEYPELAAEFLRRQQGYLPEHWQAESEAFIQTLQQQGKAIATRKASLQCLNRWAPMLPEVVGGSADLSGSNCTNWSGCEVFSAAHTQGNYIEYGVREFAMSAIMNGLALHGGFIPFSGTFLTFTDYARNAVRLSALMKQRVIYVYTHDSIGLGEDGPTHQPIEHAAMLRMTPDIHVWRPCDVVETAVAWQQALQYQGPSALLLTRQNIAHQTRSKEQLAQIAQGGYVLQDPEGGVEAIDAIVMATGSEIELAMEAAAQLQAEDIQVRVVSMPCCDLFKAQSTSYQQKVLPPEITTRVAVEAGVSDYWYQFVGLQGRVIGIDRFGLSAPASEVYRELGVTVEQIKQAVLAIVQQHDANACS